MGGKQKQANRTKGNVRPSSSARAAEQLAASGNVSGFIGFGALSGDLGYVPTSQGNEEADSTVDGDFRMVLRKLSKRDATTKLKALQELVTLIKEKDEASVKSVLPFWPRVYNKVSVDNDRRVRESLQVTFEVLVLKVRRSLAPHLKQLMGSWLVAQNDVYAPAASSARSAFQAAFPPAKQTEAVNFCKEEIMAHIKDNLIDQTPTSLSDPKSTDPEDMESKYEKMVAASLSAWRGFMGILQPDQLLSLQDSMLAVLTNGKLWKHAKSSNPMIKSAFYSLMAGLCQHNGEVANKMADKICPVVLHNLDETDPSICPALWEAVLSTVSAIHDCWSRVNARKAVWPKLWSLLRLGGSGSATFIYPNMLPLLSKIPNSVMEQPVKFYTEFFQNMKHGLYLEKTQAVHSESAAVVLSMMECLRYCLVRHLTSEQEDRAVQNLIINDQVLPLVGDSLVDKNGALSSSPLYSSIADFMLYLDKVAKSESQEEQDKALQASRLLTSVWQSISDVIKSHVKNGESAETLDRAASFLVSFKYPVKIQRKKSRVRFSEGGEKQSRQNSGEGSYGVLPSSPGPSSSKPSMLKRHTSAEAYSPASEDLGNSVFLKTESPLMILVCDTCRLSHDNFHQKGSAVSLAFLSQVFSAFFCRNLLTEMYRVALGDAVKEEKLESDCLRTEVFKHVLLPWLEHNIKDSGAQKESVQKSIIDMMVVVIRTAETQEKISLLEAMMEVDISVLSRISRRILAIARDDPAVVRWFRGPVFGDRVVATVRELCEESMRDRKEAGDTAEVTVVKDTAARWDLLTLALSSSDKLESVVGEDYVDEMLTEMRLSLPSPNRQKSLTPGQVNSCVSFVCDVATNFYSNIKGCLLVASAEALLAALFTLSCQANPTITDAVQEKVTSSWQLGVRALLAQCGGFMSDNSFFSQVAAQIKAQVLSDSITFTRLEHLAKLSVSLCHTISEELMGGDDDEEEEDSGAATVALFRRMLLLPYNHSLTKKWWDYHLVSGTITMVTLPDKVDNSSVHTLPRCLVPPLFSSYIMADCGLPYDATCQLNEGDITDDPVQPELRTVLDMVFAAAFCRSLLGERRMALSSSEVAMATTQLEMTISRLLDSSDCVYKSHLLTPLINRSLSEGRLWSVALGLFLELTPNCKIWSSDISKIIKPADRLNNLTEASLQTLQVALRYLSHDDIRPDVLSAQVITCPQENLTLIEGGLGVLSLLVTQLDLFGEPFMALDDSSISQPKDILISVLDELRQWRQDSEQLFAFEKTLSSLSRSELTFNTAMIRLLRHLVAMVPTMLDASQWDFILCSMVAWVQAAHESRSDLVAHVDTQAFVRATLQLVAAVGQCMRHVLPIQTDAFPPNLATEWREFFSPGAYNTILPLFIQLNELMSQSEPTAADFDLLTQFCLAVVQCPGEQIRNHQLPPRLIADQDSSLPDELQTLLNHVSPLLLSPYRAVQVTAYRLVVAVVADLAAFDVNVEKEGDDKKEEVLRSPPGPLLSVLETTGAALDLLVHELRVGDRITIHPHTQEYTVTMAYLLSWKLMLAFFRAAPSELRAQYALFLRDMGAVDALLRNVFHVMPENPLVPLKDSLTSTSPSQKLASISNMFAEIPRLDPAAPCLSQEVQHLACSVYSQALQDVPAMVRTWLNMQDRRSAEIVDKYTTKFVTPLQVSSELAAIRDQQVSMDNMTIVVRPAAREVLTTYSVDDISMEMVLTLPVNHPLGVISVETGKRIGVANTQWRNWMLQLCTYLTHQNGSIVEGLMLWKRNIDKRFEGVDDCMICFSVIHGSNYQLPRLICRVCKKRFHSACLYKWFSTSNNSTCPLCRSLF